MIRVKVVDILARLDRKEEVPVSQVGFLGMLLGEIGKRAAEINDPALNALMAQVGIYSVSDAKASEFMTWRERWPADIAAQMVELKRTAPVREFCHLMALRASRGCSAKKAAALKLSGEKGRQSRAEKAAGLLPPGG